MPTAVVTFNGRITLPSHIRKQLGLKTGDSVDFVEIGKGRFAIAPRAGTVSASSEDSKGWIPNLGFSSAADAMDEAAQ
ncbi:MAG: AbrB/MazE/SpoVT family DNA-binding domain-containing protein [Terracidiphilus sp.]|jgi:AbrB family looped-hinge helix DNA binding protein